MCKKLMVLLLVLGIAGAASAGTYSFVGNSTGVGRDWNNAANWDSGIVPTLTDTARLYNYFGTNGLQNPVITAVGGAVTVKTQLKGDGANPVSSLDIYTSLHNDGSFEAYQMDTTVTVHAGASLNLGTRLNTAVATAKLGGGGKLATVNVEGTMTVNSWNTANGLTTLSVGNRSGGGGALINIGAAGLVTADDLFMQTDPLVCSADIDIVGNGRLEVAGNAPLVFGYRNLGQITVNGGTGLANVYYDAVNDVTVAEVPEPAMIALLGIGGLLLRKRR